eukprot:GHVS01091717.1.p1 GENE.GHVS01091717.1~~GHVS01091717.1.p1  ORF type:complete len:609 (+),score=122.52 GHVS01091717.1:94-1920(+)
MKVRVAGPRVRYLPDCIEAVYPYDTVEVVTSEPSTPSTIASDDQEAVTVRPVNREFLIRTDTRVSKTGLMIVGLGGNNGSTLLAGILANRHNISWHTKEGRRSPNWVGSLCMSSTTKLATNTATGEEVFVPLNHLLPMLDPSHDIEVGGWDISGMNMADALGRAKVLDYDLQRQLKPLMEVVDVRGGGGVEENGRKKMAGFSNVPLPAVYISDYIAENQRQRADNVLSGDALHMLMKVREDIRQFKRHKQVERVVVMWSATTERFVEEEEGVNDNVQNLLKSIVNNHREIAPSTIYAVAAILEGCSYINGSPQNTILPCVADLADAFGVFVGGSDFKSGQTKLKSVLVDFLVSAGIRPRSIVSYNHLGNNDGLNLSSPLQFRSKQLSKSNVVDDMVASNPILYPPPLCTSRPDHCVVIKYVPAVGDSKRAMDEYNSEIFLGGESSIAVYNVCEDSLLAVPLMLDLVMLTELCHRIRIRQVGTHAAEEEVERTGAKRREIKGMVSMIIEGRRKPMVNGKQQKQQQEDEMPKLHSVLSLLGYLCKAPLVPAGTPVVNALFSQREAIVNLLRACLALPPNNHMLLEYKVHPSALLPSPPFLQKSKEELLML